MMQMKSERVLESANLSYKKRIDLHQGKERWKIEPAIFGTLPRADWSMQ